MTISSLISSFCYDGRWDTTDLTFSIIKDTLKGSQMTNEQKVIKNKVGC